MRIRDLGWFTVASAAVAVTLAVPVSGAGASRGTAAPVTLHLELPTITGGGTFTATGPVRPSGTIAVPQLGQGLTKVLTCDDGSGTFAVHVYGPAPTLGAAPSEWRPAPEYATGAYVGMRGSGTVSGGTCVTQTAACDADLQGEVLLP